LIERRHAYESGGDVFFDVRSDTAYGSLSHRNIEHMDQGEGEGEWDARSPLRPPARPATRLSIHPSPHPTAAHKRDHLDFALWKAHKQGEDTSWQAPWGMGRPGWHIECSAMAESLLGVGFDIHGGGSDLVFPHHENEAAQTRAARGRQLARIWMHNGMIQATGEKMAKSVGNIALLHEVIERWGREAVIMYLIGGHYRQPLAFSESELEDADRRVHRIREAMRRLDHGATSPQEMARHRDAFFDALADDFNTPKALASLFEWVRDANRRDEPAGDADLMEMLAVIGLGEMEPWGGGIGDPEAIDQEAYELAMEREQARWAKDFARADALRKQIRAKGWEVRDGPQGPELIPLVAER
jgi:cysteinyl-tRNA synthetase